MKHILRVARAVLSAALLFVAAACGSSSHPGDDGFSPALARREITAGAVTIAVTMRRLDDTGAVFDITLDTHAVSLDMDLSTARLTVGDRPWPNAQWQGDAPGGHRREGELRFDPAGTAQGRATLRLDGFPAPVEASWDL